ncbi:MAG: hydroxyisourate hydrolase [Polyangiaceae bacterium]|nr:hydroxyisourate hydrolase [Polyangiaceae bacterium]
MSPITTHVLDTARGRPAADLAIHLERRSPDGTWTELGRGVTDSDGRLRTLLDPAEVLLAGFYKITFDTGGYFAALGIEGFYPEASVVFEVREPGQHYHVPLLLSPYGYSTYRGS